MAKRKTGFVYDPIFLKHETGHWHPECPDRIRHVLATLQKTPEFDNLVHIKPRKATHECLENVHTKEYWHRVREACRRGHEYLDCEDVRICPASFDVALMAAGAGLALADALFDKRIQNGFALIRPPGHHAEVNKAMGFCLFNNIAILVQYCRKKYGIDRIFILDWDVHHGNGTQHIFEKNSSVFYVSLHQYPFYPGTGSQYETGYGDAEGTTLNCPMPAGSGDREYVKVFEKTIIPVMQKFQPELVCISAGFDAHSEDPLAEIQLSTEMYGWMTQQILTMSDALCAGRVLSLLEGGYNLNVLGPCIASHLEALNGTPS